MEIGSVGMIVTGGAPGLGAATAAAVAGSVAQFFQLDHGIQFFASRGMLSIRSTMMLRCTSSLPPARVQG